MTGGHLVAVVGLKREAAVLRGLDVVTVAGGGDPERLAADLAEAAKGADGIISFGMAGALVPELRLGDWVIGGWVGDIACDADWIASLSVRLPQARLGRVHADGRLVTEPSAKHDLHAASGALVADMESHVAAAEAARAGVPLAVLRCVSDEAGSALPPAIAVAMKPGGGLAVGAMLGSLAKAPHQLPHLLRTGRGFARAYRELGQGARLAGPRLAFPGQDTIRDTPAA